MRFPREQTHTCLTLWSSAAFLASRQCRLVQQVKWLDWFEDSFTSEAQTEALEFYHASNSNTALSLSKASLYSFHLMSPIFYLLFSTLWASDLQPNTTTISHTHTHTAPTLSAYGSPHLWFRNPRAQILINRKRLITCAWIVSLYISKISKSCTRQLSSHTANFS